MSAWIELGSAEKRWVRVSDMTKDEPDPRAASAVIRLTGTDLERLIAAREKPPEICEDLVSAFRASHEMFGEGEE